MHPIKAPEDALTSRSLIPVAHHTVKAMKVSSKFSSKNKDLHSVSENPLDDSRTSIQVTIPGPSPERSRSKIALDATVIEEQIKASTTTFKSAVKKNVKELKYNQSDLHSKTLSLSEILKPLLDQDISYLIASIKQNNNYLTSQLPALLEKLEKDQGHIRVTLSEAQKSLEKELNSLRAEMSLVLTESKRVCNFNSEQRKKEISNLKRSFKDDYQILSD